MDKPHKKIRITGEQRAELDIARFADALITFALRRLEADGPAVDPATVPADAEREAS